MELFDPFFVTKVESQLLTTVTIRNLTTHLSTLSKIAAIVSYYQMWIKRMTTCFAVSVLIVTGVRVVVIHGV